MNNNFRIEEYFPGGSFLKQSFERDRMELSIRFPEFSAAYLTSFEAKLNQVQLLERDVVLTDEQEEATRLLYEKIDEVDSELNFLSFYFKRASLDSSLVSSVKRELNRGNVEGALDKIAGLLQFIAQKNELLVSKGMTAGYPDELIADRDSLVTLNELQNEKINALRGLYNSNKIVYKELFSFITTVAAAGKLMYKGSPKAAEYTISKIISRLRSGNSGA